MRLSTDEKLRREIAALYDVLAEALGAENVVMRAGKLGTLKEMRSSAIPERLLALQRLVFEDPTLETRPAKAQYKKVIAEIEDRMARAQIIDVSKLSGSQVKFGATVSVIDEDTEEQARYQIVGEHEADVRSGKISIASPIARAMIGKEMGDVVEVNTPGGVKAYEIVKVEWV